MTHSRTVLITSSLALAFFCGATQAQPAAQGGKPMITLQMPATPDPARVTLDAKDHCVDRARLCRGHLQRAAELQGPDAAGHDPVPGAHPQSGPRRGVRHARAEHGALDERGRANAGRHQDPQHGPGPVLQHRSGQGSEGKRHQDTHHGRLEDQRFGDLHIGRSDGARLHRRHSDGHDLGRQQLRDDHRFLQCPEFRQCEPGERTHEAESP